MISVIYLYTLAIIFKSEKKITGSKIQRVNLANICIQ